MVRYKYIFYFLFFIILPVIISIIFFNKYYKIIDIETNKLFGHKNDVMCLARSNYNENDNKFYLVSSCKSRDTKSSTLLLWDISNKNMLCVGQLYGHDSTVVVIKFSLSNKYIASSGKDRSLCIFEKIEKNGIIYENQLTIKSAHKRIIWDLTWSSNEKFIITSSRDGTFKLWNLIKDEKGLNIQVSCTYNPFNNLSVTAIDLLPNIITNNNNNINDDLYLACGSENGDIVILKIKDPLNLINTDITLIHTTPNYYSHGNTVQKLKWNPLANDKEQKIKLASCGEDHSIRIFEYSNLI